MLRGAEIRARFPIFQQAASKATSHYLDSAATTHKPQEVIETITHFLSYENANIHRGAYSLSADASLRYEETRAKVAALIGAQEASSIIFTAGTTASINLAAYALRNNLKSGDAILLSVFEHHSNFIPWQLIARERGATLHIIPGTPSFEVDIQSYLKKLEEVKPKMVAFTAISNAFGTIFPLQEMIAAAKKSGALVLIDAAQLVAHHPLDVSALDCDFLAFSGHKMYGPTGVGVLYVKPSCYSLMSPFMAGGGMIEWVEEQEASWAEPPHKFEAGTPPIAEVLGLGRAVDFLQEFGLRAIEQFEATLFEKAQELLTPIPSVQLYGPAVHGNRKAQAGILAFNLENVHPHDLATILDESGVQIRAGHHCAMPLLKYYGIPAVARASLGIYSTEEDLHALVEGIARAKKVMKV